VTGIAHICILDTSALKNATAIEIAGRRLIEWANEIMDTRVPDEVIEEVKQKYQAHKDKWEDAYRFATQARKVGKSGKSMDFFDSWVKKHRHPDGDLSLARNLGKGERACASMALQLAVRRRTSFLNFTLIDDHARFTLNEFYRRHAVGIAITTPDLILLILNRKRTITRNQATGAVMDFYAENEDRKMDRFRHGYLADVNSSWRSAPS
jgi:hypothetical protein